MPYKRPGNMKYVTATKAVMHGDPCVEENWTGVAVKQKAPSASAGSGTPQKQVAVGENFAIINKGIVLVHSIIGAARGTLIYITAATNALTTSAGGNVVYGRIVELGGERGTPAGKMRVDLDSKV